MYRKFQLASLLLLLVNAMAQATDKQEITLAYYVEPNSNLYGKWTELIYTDAFARLDIVFTYRVMPAIRASKMADLGRVDGEAARTLTYEAEHTNLVRIKEPIMLTNISAFTHNPAISVNSWDDIKNSQYKVEYYRGVVIAHQRLSSHSHLENVTDSSVPINSLRKLIRGRIDVYIDVAALIKELLLSPEFSNEHIQMVTTLEEFKVYGYLHKRHTALAIKLAEVFHKMKSEGLFEVYFNQARDFIDSQNQP
ncbi:hypothetical protein HQQ94_19985 [Shewanella sp. VB17]|uniref:hypothetical protein n=1 Tax=Shewanella sp. VB17 TaxID=2739432 RepID=UPI0015633C90|nr:hypothetical protein [Shewanella sp. VB17]NRD75458.1 hypothetical protein [Shewanella sp. VB17]